MKGYDYDFIIIGSGFGGSVSAMRLSQKGYSVAVIEAGRKYASGDFTRSNWGIKKYIWKPGLFCYGILQIKPMRHMVVLAGTGVGGGSLGYAGTLYVPGKDFFQDKIINRIGGDDTLLPYYGIASRMLGIDKNPKLDEPDQGMKMTAVEFGCGDSFHATPTGIYFGEPDVLSPDPYFMGEGPERTGCNFCGGCYVGCNNNSKNSLDKNYLYFAEKLGATVIPETKAISIVPLSEDGADGYRVDTVRSTRPMRSTRISLRSKHVLIAAGVIGTVELLLKMKDNRILPRLSEKLGHLVRTNNESMTCVTVKKRGVDFSKGVAITSSVQPDDYTRVEVCRYPKGFDMMGACASGIINDGMGGIPRWVKYIKAVLSHPLRCMRLFLPFGFSCNSVILLIMQSINHSVQLVLRRRWLFPFAKKVTSAIPRGADRIPSYIQIGNDFTRALAKRMDGYPRGFINEVMCNIPTTGHILGGCCMSESPADGVVDLQNRVFGYQNLWICDGSTIPANLGVNPSLTIAALTERAMSFVHHKHPGGIPHRFSFEKIWGN
ncbi:MAG: GMC family oxidoreductase [Proteobacteria bacterium]|nr:GMC family oxidoreductase [Pseudomonadota bacterium]